MNTTENFDHILLFKTNVNCDGDKKLLHTLLDGNPDVQCWTVDMDDEDYVLRIVSYTLSHLQIIELMNSRGQYCCELT
ncbi:hypothetical protein NAF17_08630 [Mucilaginibacter sp. RB4R14]|uniref:hypothetical protein n=1 Tax=Mucilaginibacter aurantiaciroseus TaxID=2949308 RepID=UPI0020908E87|nr:hypothetical protein [Mucilaginibacter aurantiaciroseus]MCO5935604.1 hypothetical protein [Mucilaginibacter aurantiaciroseus]